MKTQILIEQLSPEQSNLIVEASDPNAPIKSMWLKGTMMQADIYNRNGRKYPLSEMLNAVKSMQKQIQETGGICGELDHPDRLTINLENISHMITEAYMDGSNVIGKMKILNTPKGLIAQELYKSGIKPNVSSRGSGQVLPDGIVEGFICQTVDLVYQGSAPGATPSTIYESLQGKKVLTLAEQTLQDTTAQKYFNKEFKKFLSDFFKK